MANLEPPLTVGEKVLVTGKRKGTVMYVGETAFGPGEWVGVELEKPTGSHDGEANGQVKYDQLPTRNTCYARSADF
jgi:dynactin 1